jgi:tetratricopeptide (TPR) repeat protein
MLKDAQGLFVTTDSPATIAAIDRFIDQSLSYGQAAETSILQAIAADPTCAIAHAYAAAYYLAQENAVDRKQALPYLQAAQQLQTETEREQLYIQAIVSWANRAIGKAIAYHEELAQRFPHDLISVQQGQYHYFYQGDTIGLLRLAETVLPNHSNNPYLLGMLAFGLEQCHRWQEAERVGQRATVMQHQNPWAHHAVAHVLEMQGRSAEGIAWMEALSPTWESCNSMLYTHNWWHVALFYLAAGDWQQALHLYDQHIWGRARQSSPKDQVGAISLLLRLELKGIQTADRWQTLVPHLLPRLHEHALPFQDLHYVYALARAEQATLAYEMLVSMHAYAQSLEPMLRRQWTEITIPAAQGLIAHATRNWQNAITHLQPILPRLGLIGGSHAQRQVFEQVYLDALRCSELRQAA